jgi:hypothetical protein
MPQATTKTTRKGGAKGTGAQERAFVSRLTDAGEEALQRLAELPGGKRTLGALNDLRSRVDDMAKKVRGIDALEARIVKLEKQVAELKAPRKPTAAASASTRRKTPA